MFQTLSYSGFDDMQKKNCHSSTHRLAVYSCPSVLLTSCYKYLVVLMYSKTFTIFTVNNCHKCNRPLPRYITVRGEQWALHSRQFFCKNAFFGLPKIKRKRSCVCFNTVTQCVKSDDTDWVFGIYFSFLMCSEN